MKNFLSWFGVIAFLAALFFFVYLHENHVDSQFPMPTPKTEGQVFGDLTQIGNIQYVKIAGVQVKVELATTPEAKALGLGGRAGLATNTGMLFVFYQSGRYAFWMKDMKFPIDIIWIRDDKEVVYIKKNLSPDTYPASFQPEENVKYVLELPAGFSDRNSLKVGDKAEFIY